MYRAGRFAEAAEFWKQAIADGDTAARTYYNLGTALLKAEQPDEARADPLVKTLQSCFSRRLLPHFRQPHSAGASPFALVEPAPAVRSPIPCRN